MQYNRKKIDFIFEKCRSSLNPEVGKLQFKEKSIDLIAKIRDRSTINSEKPTHTKDKYLRISAINNITLKLSSEISSLIVARSRPMSEWEWPRNY